MYATTTDSYNALEYAQCKEVYGCLQNHNWNPLQLMEFQSATTLHSRQITKVYKTLIRACHILWQFRETQMDRLQFTSD